MNFVDAIKQVIAAGQDLQSLYDLFEGDPQKQEYINKLTDALGHLEKAAQDIGLPL